MEVKLNQNLQDKMDEALEKVLPQLLALKEDLYHYPEIGGQEFRSSKLLQDFLSQEGFQVQPNLDQLETAFKAVYDSGKPGPIVTYTAEFDALVGVGHGCGHNWICTTSLGAATALKSVLDEIGGKVMVLGTPGEENICCKVQLSDHGYFDEADLVIQAHPLGYNAASGFVRAIDALQVDFYGRSSHAGMAPEKGINALDAATNFYVKLNQVKQTYPDLNIHGVFVASGDQAGIIPDYAAIKYLIRADTYEQILPIHQVFEDLAKECASQVAPDCQWKLWRNEPVNLSLLNNQPLSQTFNCFYESLDGGAMPELEGGAGSDIGNVSWVRPTIHPWIGLNAPDFNLHTKEFANHTLTQDADLALERAAKAMAYTGAEVILNPDLLARIQAEFAAGTQGYQAPEVGYGVIDYLAGTHK